MNRVLIISAHPDDETLGCGGLISKYIKSFDAVRVLILGEGSSCRYSAIESQESISDIKIRKNSAKKAMSVLGVNELVTNDLPCGRFNIIPMLEINKLIEEQIKDFKPDTIFTHAESDLNNDHIIVNKASLIASRPGIYPFLKNVISYEVLSSSEWSFTNHFSPNYFESLSDENIKNKWDALSCYDSETREFPFPRSREGLFNQAMNRGMQSGCKFAEAFSIIRSVK